MNKVMIICRGASGSGKSTWVQNFIRRTPIVVSPMGLVAMDSPGVFSTDDFFLKDGNYVFDPKMLGAHHRSNQQNASTFCSFWKDKAPSDKPVYCVVDNTNIRLWEMEPYVKIGKENGFKVFQKPFFGQHESAHGVPPEKVEQMRQAFEKSSLPIFQ